MLKREGTTPPEPGVSPCIVCRFQDIFNQGNLDAHWCRLSSSRERTSSQSLVGCFGPGRQNDNRTSDSDRRLTRRFAHHYGCNLDTTCEPHNNGPQRLFCPVQGGWQAASAASRCLSAAPSPIIRSHHSSTWRSRTRHRPQAFTCLKRFSKIYTWRYDDMTTNLFPLTRCDDKATTGI